jgi:DinB superfamily
MATAKELRDSVTKNRAALVAAIEAAAGKWETSPGGDAWSPRQNAEHAVGSDVYYGKQAAAILGGNPPTAPETTFESAAAAAEALAKVGTEVDKRFSWAEDRDLSKGQGGNTLESIFAEAAKHLAEHAENISKV